MTGAEIQTLLGKQREYYKSGVTIPVNFRIEQLKKLYATVKKYENEVNDALTSDLGKSHYEGFMCESGLVLSEISYMIRHTKRFAKRKTVYTPLAQFASHSFKQPVPYGNTLIMSPWNYPFLLTIDPLADAIAAGNTAIVKPSAYSPATSKIIEKIITESFAPEYVAVVTGGRAENAALLEQKFDFVLADLGVSSMQIDDPARGFTFKEDGPLDLRMDPTKGEPASALLKKMNAEEMAALFSANSDEPYAERIAKEIDHTRHKDGAVRTTMQLHAAISRALSFLPEGEERKEAVRKSSQRCFQALRMEVNGELSNLQTFLDKLPLVTAPGARIAILTFHSGEDRLVKRAFREGLREGVYAEIAKDVIRPSAEECFRNPRAHSTKLRYAVRG